MSTELTLAKFLEDIKPLLPSKDESDKYKALAPLVLLAALDGDLAETKAQVLDEFKNRPFNKDDADHLADAKSAAERPFFNVSHSDLASLGGDPRVLVTTFPEYMDGFSPQVKEVLTWLDAKKQLSGASMEKLVKKLAVYSKAFSALSGRDRNALFDDIAKVSVGETAKKAFEAITPRDVVDLVVGLCLKPHQELLSKDSAITSVYDPAFGTAGFLTRAARWLKENNSNSLLRLYGHERTPRTAGVGRGNLLISKLLGGFDEFQLENASSLGDGGLGMEKAHYVMCNPPYGAKWEYDQDGVRKSVAGRYLGLPAIGDGQMLFMQQALYQLTGSGGRGNRAVLVSNGSPLFTGAAGSGPSDIRGYFLDEEKDWLDTIVALPANLYFNTGIQTYLWIFDKDKPPERRGQIRLVDASYGPDEKDQDGRPIGYCEKMRKTEGDKRVQMSPAHREAIEALVFTHWAHEDERPANVKIFRAADFRYHRITVDRPLRLKVNAGNDAFHALLAEPKWQALATTNAKSDVEKKTKQAVAKQAGLLTLLHDAADKHPADANAFMTYVADEAKTRKTKPVDGKQYKLSWSKTAFNLVVSTLMVRDPDAEPLLDADGTQIMDPDLRDYENVPDDPKCGSVDEMIKAYMASEVLPHVPGARVTGSSVVGYEIPFTRHFYVYEPPRKLSVIGREIRSLRQEIDQLMDGIEDDLEAFEKAQDALGHSSDGKAEK